MRASRVISAAALIATVTGCYTLQPARGVAPVVGTVVAFDINDAGRVALGGSMGPEIAQIEGRLLDRDTSEYVVAVSSLKLLRGGEQVWHGERARIKSEYVTSLYEKRFSVGRSIAMGAAGIGAIAIIAGQAIIGSGSTDSPPPPPGGGETIRIPRP